MDVLPAPLVGNGLSLRLQLVAVLKALPPTSYRQLLALADRLNPLYRRAFLDAVEAVDQTYTGADWMAAATGGHPTGADLWAQFQTALERLRAVVQRAVLEGGVLTTDRWPDSIRAQLQFDLTNPHAVRAIETVVTEAVREIANASGSAIALTLRTAYQEGVTTQVMARRIRDVIGLTDRAATAVNTYRTGLLASDMPAGKAELMAAEYADRLLRLRAMTIARTETIRATVAGQQAAWADATAKGLLDREIRQRWIVTDDDRLCPLCEAVPDLNPEGVPLGQPFDTPSGPRLGPPQHPMCRCAVVLAA